MPRVSGCWFVKHIERTLGQIAHAEAFQAAFPPAQRLKSRTALACYGTRECSAPPERAARGRCAPLASIRFGQPAPTHSILAPAPRLEPASLPPPALSPCAAPPILQVAERPLLRRQARIRRLHLGHRLWGRALPSQGHRPRLRQELELQLRARQAREPRRGSTPTAQQARPPTPSLPSLSRSARCVPSCTTALPATLNPPPPRRPTRVCCASWTRSSRTLARTTGPTRLSTTTTASTALLGEGPVGASAAGWAEEATEAEAGMAAEAATAAVADTAEVVAAAGTIVALRAGTTAGGGALRAGTTVALEAGTAAAPQVATSARRLRRAGTAVELLAGTSAPRRTPPVRVLPLTTRGAATPGDSRLLALRCVCLWQGHGPLRMQ